MILLALLLQRLGNFTLISIVMGICLVLNSLITYKIGKKKNSNYKLTDIIFVDTLMPQRS